MITLLMFRLRDLSLLPSSAVTRNHMRKVAEAHTQELGNALLFLHYSKL